MYIVQIANGICSMISTIKKAEFCILWNQKSVPPNHWKWLLSASKEEIDDEFEYWTEEEGDWWNDYILRHGWCVG